MADGTAGRNKTRGEMTKGEEKGKRKKTGEKLGIKYSDVLR